MAAGWWVQLGVKPVAGEGGTEKGLNGLKTSSIHTQEAAAAQLRAPARSCCTLAVLQGSAGASGGASGGGRGTVMVRAVSSAVTWQYCYIARSVRGVAPLSLRCAAGVLIIMCFTPVLSNECTGPR